MAWWRNWSKVPSSTVLIFWFTAGLGFPHSVLEVSVWHASQPNLSLDTGCAVTTGLFFYKIWLKPKTTFWTRWYVLSKVSQTVWQAKVLELPSLHGFPLSGTIWKCPRFHPGIWQCGEIDFSVSRVYWCLSCPYTAITSDWKLLPSSTFYVLCLPNSGLPWFGFVLSVGILMTSDSTSIG